MPLSADIDGKIAPDKVEYKESKFMTEEQAKHVYSKIKAEESFLISEQGYTMGKLLDGTECQV